MKVYLDNAATTYPKPKTLYTNIAEIYKNIGVNSSRGKYENAIKMNEIEIELRKNLLSFVGINKVENLILGPSATIALNQILFGLEFTNIKNVYISPFEHNAVLRPLKHLESIYNFKIIVIPFIDFDWDEAKTKLLFNSKKPDLVVLNHASNVFGNILPIENIFKLSKTYDAITVLDSAQTFGLLRIDLNQIPADFVSFAGHKTLYGPSGIGGFVINTKLKLNPILFGGTGINSEETGMPETLPERFEVGSTNALGIIGLHLSTKWLKDIGIEQIYKKKQRSFDELIKVLKNFNKHITIFTSGKNVGVVSIKAIEYSPNELGNILDDYGIAVRTGLHCAPIAHKHMKTNPEGTIRLSVGYFSKKEDFEYLQEIFEKIF